MDDLKQKIVDCICTSINVNFPEKKYSLRLDSNNYAKDLRGDIINTNLLECFQDKQYTVHPFLRGGWEGRILLDVGNKVAISITTAKNLYNIPKKINRETPHYMEILLNVLNEDINGPVQLSISNLGNSFDEEVYNKNFKKIKENTEINFEEFTYFIVTYKFNNNNVVEITWNLLNKDFNIVTKENLNSLIKLDYSNLTNVMKGAPKEVMSSSEEKNREKGIKLSLQKSVKQKKSIINKIGGNIDA